MYEYFGSSVVICWSSSENFFTKMISEESSAKFNRQNSFHELYFLCSWLPVKKSNYNTKIWNFSYFYSPFSSYEWLDNVLKHLDFILPICRKIGIHILIDLYTPSGEYISENRCCSFQEKRFQDTFLKAIGKCSTTI